MNELFKPKGRRSQWIVIYDRLSGLDIGDTITDGQLAALLPDAPEGSVRVAFHRAVRQVEQDLHRTFDRVRTIGYRMVQANEHEDLARRQHRKANRRLASAQRKAHSADRTLLSPEERKRIDAIEDHLTRQREMIRRLDGRLTKAETRVATTEKDQMALADRVDQMQQLLARHGIRENN